MRKIIHLGNFRRSQPRQDSPQEEGVSATEEPQVNKNDSTRADPRSGILHYFDGLSTVRNNVFTVWRPTSAIAIQLMMQGEGTGKGLEIKGKSSKAGRLSGFVPFLQIHDEAHKSKVATLPRGGRTRIFFPTRQARDQMIEQELEPMQNHVINAVLDAKRSIKNVALTGFFRPTTSIIGTGIQKSASQVGAAIRASDPRQLNVVKAVDESLANLRTSASEGVSALSTNMRSSLGRATGSETLRASATSASEAVSAAASKLKNSVNTTVSSCKEQVKNLHEAVDDSVFKRLLWDMDDPSIRIIDDYAPQCYGLELPDRLLWKALVQDKDISRPKGTDFDTARPSMPAFQDMNFLAIIKTRKNQPEEEARVVLWQTFDDLDVCSDARGLVMAYEEHGVVLPVVSDFDCFTMGTRGLSYDQLPDDQIELQKWCVSQIQAVLDSKNDGSTTWTNRWLEILKQCAANGFHPSVPRYGFGDRKSYEIMQCAVSNLTDTGAVRHGAECFNFYFPQELDDEFLVVSGTLPDQSWRYVGVQDLQDFLLQKIDEGFTFPLNPKWVLCDNGWKTIYDRLLMSSDPFVKSSLAFWFPVDSGIREKIEEIHMSHPDGFFSGERDPDLCATEAMDLAMLDLDRFMALRRAKIKFRVFCTFNSLLESVRRKKHFNDGAIDSGLEDAGEP